LLQFTIEQGARTKGLGLDVKELTNAIFARLGMTRTSLQWRPHFGPNLADGWNDKGEPQEHDERSNVRVAGSMDTTISDLAKFIAALVRGDGLSMAARAEMVKPSLHIGTAHQFPNFAPYLPKAEQRSDLAAGLGVIVRWAPRPRILQRWSRRTDRQHLRLKPAFLTIGNMPVRRASPDRLLSSSQARQNVSRSAN
jgi:CubicO group peptidase (beta-lactamase class C family)